MFMNQDLILCVCVMLFYFGRNRCWVVLMLFLFWLWCRVVWQIVFNSNFMKLLYFLIQVIKVMLFGFRYLCSLLIQVLVGCMVQMKFFVFMKLYWWVGLKLRIDLVMILVRFDFRENWEKYWWIQGCVFVLGFISVMCVFYWVKMMEFLLVFGLNLSIFLFWNRVSGSERWKNMFLCNCVQWESLVLLLKLVQVGCMFCLVQYLYIFLVMVYFFGKFGLGVFGCQVFWFDVWILWYELFLIVQFVWYCFVCWLFVQQLCRGFVGIILFFLCIGVGWYVCWFLQLGVC